MIEVPEQLRNIRKINPRPQSWADVVGNATAIEQVCEAVRAAELQQRAPAHTLLFGPPGTGKTTIAKLMAQEIGGGFVETTASTLETPTDVIRILDALNNEAARTGKPSTLFLDEAHQIGQSKGRQSIDQESVFPLLEDWAFPHNLMGKDYQALDGRTYTLISNTFWVTPFCAVAATTEPGMLSQPLLRRFLLHIQIEPYTEDDIGRIIMGSAERLEWPIDTEAAAELAKYARRNPGHAYRFLTSARNRAVATGRDRITLEVAGEMLARLKLYPLGLTEQDIDVLKLLADRPKGVGQTEICRAIGVSASQFSGLIEPYLRFLQMIETLSRRMITRAGLRYLAQIKQIDTTRPEVRAVLETKIT